METANELHVYNTMTREVEKFETSAPGKVRMYVCGVTPYSPSHVGHAMSYIVFDVIKRYLEHIGYEVRHAYNFTDIDDKIIARANSEGIDPKELTEKLIAEWHAEAKALNIKPATVYPRATTEIPAIILMIEGLIDKGFAYLVDGDVYYRVRSFQDYGKLSHRQLDDLCSGARIEVDERKEDPLDFALWKSAKPGEPRWPSPWGEGRPGWHIECSAMCSNHLGGLVDIHGGGADLIFPHHENEIAQSEAYLGEEPFSRYWLHNGLLQLNADKMSKSIGNIVKIRELLDRGLGDAYRVMVLQSHYRAPLTYSEEALQAAARGLERLQISARPLEGTDTSTEAPEDLTLADLTAETDERFHAAMNDDFDTPGAIAALFELARGVNRAKAEGSSNRSIERARHRLIGLADVLGLPLEKDVQQHAGEAAPFIELLLGVREELRTAKLWALSDKIRDGLAERGIAVEDGPSGPTWRKA
ncbi:MAG: cysteine--tRNA ligase [Thermomicrobiales bacterium]